MDKFCKDCKHSTPRYSNLVFCLHPSNIVISNLDGQPEIDCSANALRGNEKKCGPTASWHEEKA